MEFSLLNGGMLMYGGLQSGPTANLDETWLHNGSDWTQLAPATTPPARWGHRMVYDSRRARIVTFGGRSPGTTTTASDTWEWDGTDWLQMTPTNSPGARAFYSMANDERRGVTVLYGTQSGSTFSGGDETWEYDGTTWTQIVTPTTPPGLETPAMTYDKGRGVVVMFGGWNGSAPGTMYNTTWEYDGNDWTLRAPTTSPSGRYRAGCCYDDTRSRVLLYGGFGSATALQDTWEWDGNEWTQIAATGPARSTPATLPVLGSNYDLGISVGSLTTFVVIAHGLDNLEFVPGVYFPVDLAIAGIAGCDLQVRPDVTVTQLTTAGVALATIPIPNNPALTGQELFSQFFALDVAAPNGFGSMSNAVHAVLGQ